MVSKSYVPNHSLHKHYYGQGMARFKGSRMQYGKGLGSIFKRVALPLLSKGAKIAAPHVLKAAKGIFVYLGFYVAFNTVQVISRRVVGRAEETSTYSLLGFCTVNCRPTASNYQLSHLRP